MPISREELHERAQTLRRRNPAGAMVRLAELECAVRTGSP